ncbi:unnamed protein product [Amoebophrya sp. A25]|nr:unnamed protein product [Amoebophrya sp. A25]|eukprot:GSA25T00011903001.1
MKPESILQHPNNDEIEGPDFIPLEHALRGLYDFGGTHTTPLSFPSQHIFVTRAFLTTTKSQRRAFDAVGGPTIHDAPMQAETTSSSSSTKEDRQKRTTLVMKVPHFVVRFAVGPGKEALLLVSNYEAERLFANSRNLRLFCTLSRTNQDGDCLTDRMPNALTVILKNPTSVSVEPTGRSKGTGVKTKRPGQAVPRVGSSGSSRGSSSTAQGIAEPRVGVSSTGFGFSSPSQQLELTSLVPLHAFAGSVYAKKDLLRQMMSYFGILSRSDRRFERFALTDSKGEKVPPLVMKDGFVLPGKARSKDSELSEYSICEYKTSPVAQLRQFYSQARHLQSELSTSPLGLLLQYGVSDGGNATSPESL